MNSEIITKGPLVSVIIPTYKRPIYLPRAINSVLKNTWQNVEIIIVDDNTDGDEFRIETEKVMENFVSENDNILYLKHKANRNGSAARNTGLKASKGKYVMFLDDDDEFQEKKIDAQVKFMESHDLSWGACYTKYIDQIDDKTIAWSAEHVEGNLLLNELSRNLFVHAGSNLMVRRQLAIDLNGFDESFLRNQDVEFLVRILKQSKLGYVDVDGLIVHLKKKNKKEYYFDLTKQYINKFRNDIDSLSKIDKDAVLRMIGLQLIRQAMQGRDYKKIKELKSTYDVRDIEITKYLIHLFWRLVRHKAYGYPMKNLYRKGN